MENAEEGEQQRPPQPGSAAAASAVAAAPPQAPQAPTRPPWEAYFNEKCCGGDGDCFFLTASHGIRANRSKPKQMAEKEMGPG
eukprot:5404429-Pyramimonas_sp.AAC.1